MLHRLVHAAIAAIWVATMAAVAVNERRGFPAAAGPFLLAPPRIEVRPPERFRILIGGRPIGTVRNAFEPASDGGVRVVSVTEGEIPFLGATKSIDLVVEALLDRASRLETLDVRFGSGSPLLRAAGRVRGGTLLLEITGDLGARSMALPVPDGLWIQPGAGVLGRVPPGARPGDSWTFPVLNPLTLSIDEGRARVVAERPGDGGKSIREIETTIGPLATRSFVDEDGTLVREESPLGIVLERIGAEGERAR